MKNDTWTANEIPDQRGRVAVITGANTGLGLETAKALATRGATVVLAVRNLDKGKDAAASINADSPERTSPFNSSTCRRSTRCARRPTSCGHATTGSTC